MEKTTKDAADSKHSANSKKVTNVDISQLTTEEGGPQTGYSFGILADNNETSSPNEPSVEISANSYQPTFTCEDQQAQPLQAPYSLLIDP